MTSKQLKFDKKQRTTLGHYVYGLIDTDKSTILYVGQGQKSRVQDHFHDALKSKRTLDRKSLTKKQKELIKAIKGGTDPAWRIFSRNLPDAGVAELVEAGIIDALCNSTGSKLLNSNMGMKVKENGGLSAEQVIRKRAKEVNPTKDYAAVFVFPIHNAIKEGKDFYEATRRAWKVRSNLKGIPGAVAVGIDERYSECVYTIGGWNADKKISGKYAFDKSESNRPKELQDKDWTKIIKRAWGAWLRGHYLVVQFNGEGRFRFLRGCKNKRWQAIPKDRD